ncbi:unnamed protein product [Sympodiomycopsis kandeliae]
MAHFYAHSAHLLLQVLDRKNSVKAIVSSQCPTPEYTLADQKRYLATVINVLAWRESLSQVISSADIATQGQCKASLGLLWKKYVKSQPKAGYNLESAVEILLLILAHDLILSPSKRLSLSSNHPATQYMSSNKARLQAELVKLQIRSGKTSIEQLRSDAELHEDPQEDDNQGWFARSEGKWKRGRWIRVNTRVGTLQEVVQWLHQQGFTPATSEDYIASAAEHENKDRKGKGKKAPYTKQYIIPNSDDNAHPPDLILLPMEATPLLVSSPIYTSGLIILQDAASCWPAWILLHRHLSTTGKMVVLDATASPGNKTTHLSSLLHQSSSKDVQLYALERDDKRFKVLVQGLKRAKCIKSPSATSATTSGLVQPYKMDFLSTDPNAAPWNTITHMLLDPSCSGSGIVNRLDWLTAATKRDNSSEENDVEEGQEGDDEQSRLQKLSDIQLKMIEHAFQFPSLNHFVYSTCSIHSIEDEQVVHRALQSVHAQGEYLTHSNKKRKQGQKHKRYQWKVVPRQHVLPGWQWRGVHDEDGDARQDEQTDQGMIRAHPYTRIDSNQEARGGTHVLRTNGFFACAFERIWIDGQDTDTKEEENVKIHTPDEPSGQPSARARKRARQKANQINKAAEHNQS